MALTKTKQRMSARGLLDVKDFGAIGDGVTDDTNAIQSAINAMSAGDTLLFSKGTYLVSANIAAGQDAIDQGTSVYRSLKITANNITITADKGASLLFDTDPGVQMIVMYVTGNYFNISGLGFFGSDGAKPTTGIVTGLNIYGSYGSEVSNLEVAYTSGAGVRLEGCDYSYVRNCFLHDCKDTAFNGFSGCQHCAIEDSRVTNSGDGNCTFYGANLYCAMSRCYFSGASQLGVIESSHYSTIDGCFFDGSDGNANNGPIMNRSRFSSIKNNKIVGMQYGIIVRETDIAGAGGIPNWSAVVSENEIRDCQQRITGQRVIGLWLEYASNVLVTNNTFIRTQSGTAGANEIRLLNRNGYATNLQRTLENLTIENNTFLLKHTDVGFGPYNDIHEVVKNDTGDTVRNFSFNANSIVADFNDTSGIYLLDLNDMLNVSICNNQLSDANNSLGYGPFLSGTIVGGTISNNVLLCYAGDVFTLDGSSELAFNANVLGGKQVGIPQSAFALSNSCERIVISNNIGKGSARFIKSDTTESDVVVIGNMVYYDLASEYSGFTPSIDQHNTFTNY